MIALTAFLKSADISSDTTYVKLAPQAFVNPLAYTDNTLDKSTVDQLNFFIETGKPRNFTLALNVRMKM